MFGSLLSIGLQGFIAGTRNNVFHLPIIERLYELPQFATDPYIQSLRSYTSLFWLGMRKLLGMGGSRPDLGQATTVFFVCQTLSRLLSYVGFLLCATLLGIRRTVEQLIFTMLLSTTTLLRGGSAAGDGGLFLVIFTHSEFCNGLTLIVIYLAMRDRFALSWATNGITFALNFFMAVWNALPLSLILVLRIFQRKVSYSRAAFSLAIGLTAFLFCALPIVFWGLHNPDATRPGAFDYVDYLASYWPYHFLFSKVPFFPRAKLVVVIAIGVLAFWVIGKQKTTWLAILSSYLLVYAIGILLPHLSHSKLLLNLHLLRVSAMLHLLSSLAVLTIATRWLMSRETVRAFILGPALVLTCCSTKYLLLFAPIVLLASLILPADLLRFSRNRLPIFQSARIVLLVVATVFTVLAVRDSYQELSEEKEVLAAWQSLGFWVQGHTPVSSLFLLPLDIGDPTSMAFLNTSHVPVSLNKFDVSFESLSFRRGWMDSKRGAAVMWASSYYDVWKTRLAEVTALETFEQKSEYARRHGINYIVTPCDEAPGSGKTPLYRNSLACLYDPRQ